MTENKNNQKLYMKWWFWVIISFVFIFIIIIFFIPENSDSGYNECMDILDDCLGALNQSNEVLFYYLDEIESYCEIYNTNEICSLMPI